MNKPVLRISLILVVAIALLLIGKYTSVGVWFNLDNVSNVIRNSGPWGFVIFNLLFILGSLMHIPAMLFILVAILIYGHVEGALFGYLGVVIAMTANYLIIRKLGDKVLHQIPNKRLQNMLSRLQRQPLLTVILIRLVFWAAPVVNYALAMTSINTRHYIVGSAIGIILPVAIFSGAVYFFQEMIIPLVE